MQAECLLEKLKNAVILLERVSGKNLTLPILGALFLQTDDSSITIRATNLNIGAEIKIPAKITKQGTVAVSSHLLAQICNGLQGDIPVQLSVNNNNLIIQAKNSRMTLKSMSSDDFPTIPKINNTESYSIPVDQFVLGIKSVSYAAAISDIKPEIASIYIYGDKKDIIFVATDAFRLAEKRISLSQMISFPEILLPVKNATEIIRFLQESSGTIQITINENQIAFVSENFYITSRLTNGIYPDYKKIIPTVTKTEIIVLKSDLQTLIKTLSVFSDKFNQIDIAINPKEKKCIVTSQNQETGEGVITLESTLKGEPIETRINHRYITDALQSIYSDSLTFLFSESNRPVIIKGIGDSSFTYLIMPMTR